MKTTVTARGQTVVGGENHSLHIPGSGPMTPPAYIENIRVMTK
jgi:hypothetical protein